jgi:hypothetical protein
MLKIEAENANDPGIDKLKLKGATIRACYEHVPKEGISYSSMKIKRVLTSAWR